MILHLKGNQGRAIYEVDTNMVVNHILPPSGPLEVLMVDKRVIYLDREEYEKLSDAMNAPR